MTRENNVIKVLTEDHRRMEGVFGELESRQGRPGDRKGLADHALAEVVRQWTAEERYVFPEVRRQIPDGKALVRHEIDEHHRNDSLMKDLEVFGPGHPHFEDRLREFIDGYRHHAEDEEHNLVPRLQESCTEEQLEAMGDKLVRVRETAPTRPHPGTAETFPVDRVLEPGPGFINRIRDSIRPGAL
ncbi:hemerythrin domain-containing protein [Glycomyces sp. YM15]|uniref:hemerythrin domain-containing protein n=1 Tax=Glycomyces sp. YM15 TaxID=2800446 RepID=UPI00196367A2|nr:hemerythrin domain-containing protein [Glycomyces sp. YM15]